MSKCIKIWLLEQPHQVLAWLFSKLKYTKSLNSAKMTQYLQLVTMAVSVGRLGLVTKPGQRSVVRISEAECWKILLGIWNFAVRNNLWGRRRNLCYKSDIIRIGPSVLERLRHIYKSLDRLWQKSIFPKNLCLNSF